MVVAGPSGSGKSSVVKGIRDRLDVDFSVSVTTRLPRPGEIHGEHYDFISRRVFEDMVENNDLLEWAEYNNRFYGTPTAPVEAALLAGRDVLLEIDIQGARQIRAHRPDATMFFIAPPSIEELEVRLRRRGDTSEEDIEDRLIIAESEMAEAPELFDHVVVNDNLEQAIEEVLRLVTGE